MALPHSQSLLDMLLTLQCDSILWGAVLGDGFRVLSLRIKRNKVGGCRLLEFGSPSWNRIKELLRLTLGFSFVTFPAATAFVRVIEDLERVLRAPNRSRVGRSRVGGTSSSAAARQASRTAEAQLPEEVAAAAEKAVEDKMRAASLADAAMAELLVSTS